MEPAKVKKKKPPIVFALFSCMYLIMYSSKRREKPDCAATRS